MFVIFEKKVESTRRDHHIESLKMLSYLREITMKKISEEDTFRIGISGPPGVGKVKNKQLNAFF